MDDYRAFLSGLHTVLGSLGTLRITGEGSEGSVSLRAADGRVYAFKESLADIYQAVGRLDAEILSRTDDRSPIEGQLRLFSVHVEEAIITASAGAHLLVLTDYGVVTT